MLRFTFLAALAAGCQAATPAVPTTVANRADVQRYQLLPFSLMGPEGRHSARHTSTDVAGTLELDGTKARVMLALNAHVSFVHCSPAMKAGELHTMQACADDADVGSTTKHELVLTGTAATNGETLAIEVADGDRRLALACTQAMLGLRCEVASDASVLGARTGDPWTAPRAVVFVSPSLDKEYALAPITLAAWEAPRTEMLTGTLAIKGATATVSFVLGGTPSKLTGHLKTDAGGALWIGVGWVPRYPGTPLLALTCAEEGGSLVCHSAADYTVFDKFHRPDKLAFDAK